MLNLEEIVHEDLSQKTLIEICEIKSKAWSYSADSQKKWISENIKTNDIHLLLRDDAYLVGYLNLVNIHFMIDHELLYGFGIGNVCSSVKGHGYGGKIIEFANDFILKKESFGLLFCKNNLVDFYIKYGWKLVIKEKVISSERFSQINTMIYNLNRDFKSFNYSSKLF